MLRHLSLVIPLMLSIAFALPVFGVEWFPFVPQEDNVSLSYWEVNGSSFVDVAIEFWDSGFNVTDCGLPVLQGKNISVSAKIWRQGAGVVFPFIWEWKHTYDLGSLPAGKYTFTFSSWVVPIKNITFVARADCNGDGVVDISDLAMVGGAFGSVSGDPRWNEAADVHKNGIIDVIDLVSVALNFGDTG